ncbi:MAG: BlaI/MecI/CopY family transcriptional regulator [Chitinophagaceae bacterium]|nr:BlaI/MecI/CopY family transcriptional regulator [Chitinophagaceae bacterium]MCB9045516.1 BlaI/MecI/CopY family transcriptional regulator [Chitinophagales bacterium]
MNKKDIHITEAELEILQVLWEQGRATVKEVHEALSAVREAGYTTTLKQMQVMYDKGLLTRDDSRRQHIYFPDVDIKKVQQKFMSKVMNLFSGRAGELVLNALNNYKTTPEELEQIRQTIDKAKQAKKP